MNDKLRLVVTLALGALFILGLWFFAKTISSLTGYAIGSTRFDKFAQCLSDNDVVLYTSEGDCEACTQQKAIFKNSYQYLNVVNCDNEAAKCAELEINYAPVWIIKGKKYFGLQGIPRLSEITGCNV
jgi:hypothetical protein